MRLRARLLLVALLAPAALRAEGWSRTFDSGSSWDDTQWAGAAPGGGHLIGGSTDVLPGRLGDAVVARLDDAGRFVGAMAYGTGEREGAVGAAPAPDGGMYLCGATTFQFDFRLGWVARVARDGTLLWAQLLLAPTATQVTTAFAVTPIANQRVAVVGSYSEIDAPPRHAFVAVFESDGTLAWQRMLSGGAWEQGQAVAESADGGLLVAGLTGSPGTAGDTDAWLVKLSAAGDVLWSSVVGGPGRDEATGIAAMTDGGAAVIGFTDSFTTSSHAPWILRFAADGTLSWQRVAGDMEWGDAEGIHAARDGGIVVLGRLDIPGSSTSLDLWLARLDDTGRSTWQRAFDSGQGDWPISLGDGADGGLVIGAIAAWGFPEQDHWLLRVDADGRTSCPSMRDAAVALAEPRVEQPPIAMQLVPVDFAIQDGGWTMEQLPITEAVQCDACLDAGGVAPEEPSAGRPRAPWLKVFDLPTEHVEIEEVAGATALNAYVGRIGEWYAPSAATGTLCRVTSWTGAGTLSFDVDLPVNSWIAVSASNACGESSAGRDSFGVERRSVGAWESCPPGP